MQGEGLLEALIETLDRGLVEPPELLATALDEDLVTVAVRKGSNTAIEIQPILKQHAIEMVERSVPRPVEVDGVVYS